jgi:primosomal protein N' (replication factor Y)
MVVTASENIGALESYTAHIAEYIRKHSPENTEILGPAEAPIKRIRGKNRMQILLKSKKIKPVRTLLSHLADTMSDKDIDMVIDVDPLNML